MAVEIECRNKRDQQDDRWKEETPHASILPLIPVFLPVRNIGQYQSQEGEKIGDRHADDNGQSLVHITPPTGRSFPDLRDIVFV